MVLKTWWFQTTASYQQAALNLKISTSQGDVTPTFVPWLVLLFWSFCHSLSLCVIFFWKPPNVTVAWPNMKSLFHHLNINDFSYISALFQGSSDYIILNKWISLVYWAYGLVKSLWGFFQIDQSSLEVIFVSEFTTIRIKGVMLFTAVGIFCDIFLTLMKIN